MEKSIENIWKEGFITKESLKAPKINKLSDLKSIYFIDQFKTKYKRNIIFLTVTAILVLLAFILGGVPIIGLYMMLLFSTLALVGLFELKKLDQLNLGNTNYEYLQNFDHWLKNLLTKFSMLYRIWIPLLFIGFALAILKTNLFVPFIGETLLERFTNNQIGLNIGGIPLFWLSVIIIISLILSYFSDLLFKREIKSIYGDLIARIEQLLMELKELR